MVDLEANIDSISLNNYVVLWWKGAYELVEEEIEGREYNKLGRRGDMSRVVHLIKYSVTYDWLSTFEQL